MARPSRSTPWWLPFIDIGYHPYISCGLGAHYCLLPLAWQYLPGLRGAFVPRLDATSCRRGPVGSPVGRGVAGQPIPVLPTVVDLGPLRLTWIHLPFERGAADLPVFVQAEQSLCFRRLSVPTPLVSCHSMLENALCNCCNCVR